jgi:drug/metabolite transporter superfamily protein YnfA
MNSRKNCALAAMAVIIGGFALCWVMVKNGAHPLPWVVVAIALAITAVPVANATIER